MASVEASERLRADLVPGLRGSRAVTECQPPDLRKASGLRFLSRSRSAPAPAPSLASFARSSFALAQNAESFGARMQTSLSSVYLR